MPMVPSVAMNGGSRAPTTSAAASAPLATPTLNPAAMAADSGHCASTNSSPVTTDASAITAPGREVDAAGADDHRRADGADAVDPRVLEDQRHVLGIGERVRLPRPPQDEREEQELDQQDDGRRPARYQAKAHRRQKRIHTEEPRNGDPASPPLLCCSV